MGTTGIVVLVVVAIAVAVGGWLVVTRAAKKRLATLQDEVARPDLERVETASSFGVSSKGGAQVRGLGVLALSAEQLEFRPVAGKGDVRVDRTAVTGAEIVRSFLGKTQDTDLLHVTWADPEVEGGADEAAWRVPDAAWWVAQLS